MTSLKVLTFTSIKDVMGEEEFDLEFSDDPSLKDLLILLRDSYNLPEILFDGEEITKYMFVLINGRLSSLLGGVDAILKDGDEIALLPPAGGG